MEIRVVKCLIDGPLHLFFYLQSDGDGIVTLHFKDRPTMGYWDDITPISVTVERARNPLTYKGLLGVREAMRRDNRSNPMKLEDEEERWFQEVPVKLGSGIFRLGDMSPCQFLHICRVRRGVLVVSVCDLYDDKGPSLWPSGMSVEFCTSNGGGRSHMTLLALHALVKSLEGSAEVVPC